MVQSLEEADFTFRKPRVIVRISSDKWICATICAGCVKYQQALSSPLPEPFSSWYVLWYSFQTQAEEYGIKNHNGETADIRV